MILIGESPVFVPGKKKPRSESAPLKGNAQDKLEERQEMEGNVVRRSTGSGDTGAVLSQKSVSPVRGVGENSVCEFVGVYMCVCCMYKELLLLSLPPWKITGPFGGQYS